MATYYGTTGTDNFTGASQDMFVFTPADIQAADRVNGGSQGTLVLQGTGTIAAASLVGFSNFGSLRFDNGGISITANGSVPFALRPVLVFGSAGNDTLDFSATTGSLALTVIRTGGGDDRFVTNNNNDQFIMDADDLTGADYISAGAATNDTLTFETAGTVTAADFAQVYGIDKLVLAYGTNDITLGSTFGDLIVTGSNGSDRVDASAITGGLSVTAGSGLDTIIGGQGYNVFRITANQLAGDTLDAHGRGQLAISSYGTIDAADLANVSGFTSLSFSRDADFTADAAFSSRNAITSISGSSGSDTIDFSGSTDDIYWRTFTGDDRLYSGSGDDLFNIVAGRLDGSDVVSGGAGRDSIFTGVYDPDGPYLLDEAALAGVTSIESFTLSGLINVTLSDRLVSSAEGHRVSFVMTAGGGSFHTIDATALTGDNRIYVMTYSQRNLLLGGEGDDVFQFADGAIDAGDVVDGNGGTDTLILNDRVLANAAALSGVSDLDVLLLGGGSAGAYLDDAFLASNGGRFAVTARAGLSMLDASAVVDAANSVDVTVLAGDSQLTGGAGADIFRLTRTDLTTTIVGGDGSAQDVLQLRAAGSYEASALESVSGVEQIVLAAGGALVVLSDALVGSADGQRVVVSGGAGSDGVDASEVTGAGNHVEIIAGAGDDVLSGGAGADGFRFLHGELNADDVVSGGMGIDTLRLLSSGTIAAGDLAQVSGIERILLASGDDTVTVGQALAGTADAQALEVLGGGGNDVLSGDGLDGSAPLVLNGGAGDDVLTGGGRAVLIGGEGADTFRFAARGAVEDTVADFASADDMLAFAAAQFAVTGGAIDVLTEDHTGIDDLGGADVIRYAGTLLGSAEAVSDYLLANGTGTAGGGAFVIGVDGAGDTLLYHTTDASGAGGDVVLVASLSATAAGSLTLADFTLI